MKNICTLVLMLCFIGTSLHVVAQQRKVVMKKATSGKTVVKKYVEPSFAGLVPVTEIADLKPGEPGFDAVRILAENYTVPMVFGDKTFRGKETLKRGEFIVHFNSALESVRNFMDSMKYDTSLINTYDKNASYITSAAEIKDLKSTSVYYPAVQSMLERWGIAAMFTKAKLLNANLTISEAEVVDILKVTMGYANPAVSKRNVAIKRDAFAVILSDAIGQMREQALRLPIPVPDKVSDTFYIKLPYEPGKK